MIISVYFSNLSNFSSGIFSAYKDTKILAKTTIVATIINLLIGFSLIKYIGLYAPILGTLISYIVIFFYRNYKLKKYIILDQDKYLPLSLLILLLVTGIYYNNICHRLVIHHLMPFLCKNSKHHFCIHQILVTAK